MRTPGHDRELAAGFLYTEGLLRDACDLKSVEHAPDERQNGANRVCVTLADGVEIDMESTRRNFFAASSCGICGKSSIDSVRVRSAKRIAGSFAVEGTLLCSLPDRLRKEQAIFGRTGGLHAAALFSANGELMVVREDVGRHNAVDKVVGWALFNNRLPLSDSVLLVSGRGGFEIVQKAAVAGIPLVDPGDRDATRLRHSQLLQRPPQHRLPDTLPQPPRPWRCSPARRSDRGVLRG